MIKALIKRLLQLVKHLLKSLQSNMLLSEAVLTSINNIRKFRKKKKIATWGHTYSFHKSVKQCNRDSMWDMQIQQPNSADEKVPPVTLYLMRNFKCLYVPNYQGHPEISCYTAACLLMCNGKTIACVYKDFSTFNLIHTGWQGNEIKDGAKNQDWQLM